MANIISFKSNNIVNNGFNNMLRYEFPGSTINFVNAEISIHSIQMYNSQFNIDSGQYANNTLRIIMPTAATTSNINITLADGYYRYQDINYSIQRALIDAGAYLIDDDGNNVFFITIGENMTYYSAQVDLAVVPTSLPSGWSLPTSGLYSSGGSGLPSTAYSPQLVINNAEFGKIIGFSVGTYPAVQSTSDEAFLSDITPQAYPSSSYMLRCSLVNNPYSIPSDVLTTFTTQGTTVGEIIDYKPNEYLWIPVSNGSYAAIQLTIVDQDERMVYLRDTNILISLAIRQREAK